MKRQPTRLFRLIRFLRRELLVPKEAIAIALKREDSTPHLLPIILWQYGLVTLEQLDQIFDWLEATAVLG